MFNKSIIEGQTIDQEWQSLLMFPGSSRKWRPNYSMGWLEISYISEEQIENLKANFSDAQEYNFAENLCWLGSLVAPGEEGCDGSVNEVPVYWQFNSTSPILKIYFLSNDQINFLKQTDIHNAGLNDNNFFGPDSIPCYSIARTN